MNSITFLTRHLGYSFQNAVVALCGSAARPKPCGRPAANSNITAAGKNFTIPEAAPLPHRQMYAFLMRRSIPKEIVRWLVSNGLAYQSAGKNNIVFVNKERDYCEIRGTYTFAEKPFHGCRKAKQDRFRYFVPGRTKLDKAYVTEAAIDAISLFLLHRLDGKDVSRSVYISIGGASNHVTINRIKAGIATVLVVDNDTSGNEYRRHHPDLEHAIPVMKDWNDDLKLRLT